MLRQTEPIHYEVGETYVFTVHTLHDDLCDLIDTEGLHVYLKRFIVSPTGLPSRTGWGGYLLTFNL